MRHRRKAYKIRRSQAKLLRIARLEHYLIERISEARTKGQSATTTDKQLWQKFKWSLYEDQLARLDISRRHHVGKITEYTGKV